MSKISLLAMGALLVFSASSFSFAADDSASSQGVERQPAITPVSKCPQDPGDKKIPCYSNPKGGQVDGICVKGGECRAVSYTDLEGKKTFLDQGFQALSGILQGLMGQLMGGGKGGGGGSSGGSGAYENYINPADRGVADDITRALNDATDTGDGEGDLADTVDQILGGVREGTTGAVPTTGSAQNKKETTIKDTNVTDTTKKIETKLPTGPGDVKNINPQTGEIRTSADGTTFEGKVRDVSSNSETGGFYGTGAASGKAPSFGGRVCAARPWAGGFIEKVIPTSFFDNLCARWGFTPGAAVEDGITTTPRTIVPLNTTPGRVDTNKREGVGIFCSKNIVRKGSPVQLSFSCGTQKLNGVSGFSVANNTVTSAEVIPEQTTQYAIRCSNEKVYACNVQVVNPKLTIRAEPNPVKLAARTVIYWESQDVARESCTVAGKSFLEKAPEGGASTVPINGASTFTFSCMGLDGATTTEKVVVELAL